MNGISELAERGDLLDRAIVVSLPRIGEEQRRDEATLYADFEQARPRILGALCDAVAMSLRRWSEVQLERRPRMADFARSAAAAAPALGWTQDDFLTAYSDNRSAAIGAEIEASPVAAAVLRFLDQHGDFRGTATQLLDALNTLDDELRRNRAWPKTPARLSTDLNRVAPALRQSRVQVERERDRESNRILVLRKVTTADEPSI